MYMRHPTETPGYTTNSNSSNTNRLFRDIMLGDGARILNRFLIITSTIISILCGVLAVIVAMSGYVSTSFTLITIAIFAIAILIFSKKQSKSFYKQSKLLYDNVDPEIKKIKGKLERIETFGGIVIPVTLVIGYILGKQKSNGSLQMIGFLIAIIGVITIVVVYKRATPLIKIVKEKEEMALSSLFNQAFPGSTYTFDTINVPIIDWSELGILPNGNIEDHPVELNFINHNCKYTLIDATIFSETHSRRSIPIISTVFRGQVLITPFVITITAPVRILTSEKVLGKVEKTGLPGAIRGEKHIDIEDVEFNAGFEAFCSDKQSAFYALNPVVTGHLMELKKRYNKFAVLIDGKNMFIVMFTNKGILDSIQNNSNLAVDASIVNKELVYLANMSEEMLASFNSGRVTGTFETVNNNIRYDRSGNIAYNNPMQAQGQNYNQSSSSMQAQGQNYNQSSRMNNTGMNNVGMNNTGMTMAIPYAQVNVNKPVIKKPVQNVKPVKQSVGMNNAPVKNNSNNNDEYIDI